MEKQYLKEREVAKLTGFALSTLRNNRFLGKGIPFRKSDAQSGMSTQRSYTSWKLMLLKQSQTNNIKQDEEVMHM